MKTSHIVKGTLIRLGHSHRKLHPIRCVTCILTASLFLVSGCAGVGGLRWYSPTRDQQAQDLKSKLDKADNQVTSTIAAARANQKSLLDKQLALEDEMKASNRDTLIYMLANNMTFDGFLEHIEAQRKKLVGNFNGWEAFDQAIVNQNEAVIKFRRLKGQYVLLGYSMPTCAEISGTSEAAFVTKANPTTEERTALTNIIALQNKYCALNDPALAAISQIKEGEIGSANKRLGEAKRALEILDSKSKALRDCYVATAAASDSSAASTPACSEAWNNYKASNEADAKTFNSQTADRATQLKKLFDRLVKLMDTFSVKFVSETRAAAIDDYLNALINAKPDEAPAKDAPQAAAKTILVENFIDALRKADASYEKTTALPLVMLRQYDAVQADAANRDLDTRNAEISLLNEELQLQTQQLTMMNDTLKSLKALPPEKRRNPVHVLVTNCKGEDSCAGAKVLNRAERTALTRNLDNYIRSQTEVKFAAAKLDDTRAALIHERAIAASEANLTQWKTLIATSSSVLSTYGATGVKPETLLALINSLSLIAIGVGVN